jgi:hypothetical protein
MTWISGTASSQSAWNDITYGKNTFVAVSYDFNVAGGSRVMTSD